MSFSMGFPLPATAWQGGGGPSLNLDFINSSKLDPRITFSRGTQAMQYGSDGTLQYAPNNLLTYSNQADNAAWTKSNSFVQQNLMTYSQEFDNAAWGKAAPVTITANADIAPDGTLTADRFVSTGGAYPQMSQSATLSAGTYTASLWVRSDGTPQIEQSILLDGTPQAFTPTSTWTRITVTKTGIAAGSRALVIATNNPTAAASSFYIWGAQLVQGSVPGDYVATTSAALPVLYADYNGALRARKLCDAATTGTHGVTQTTTNPNGTYTFSVICKPGERGYVYLDMSDNTTGDAAVQINISAGTYSSNAVTGSWTNPSASVTSLGNGWYRCSLTATRNAGTQTISYIYISSSGGPTYTGDGSSGIYIADAQLTPGYLPLAVTETTSAAVYGPRFDYDPSSLVAQNLLTYSQNLALYWVYGTGVTLNPTSIIAPDGTLTARTVNYSAGGGTEFLRNSTSAIAASVAQTFSFWAKSISGNTSFSIDLQNIEGTTVTLTSEWQRFTWTVTPAAARTWVDFQLGAAGTVALWGVQLNQGSTALPYTATTTAPYTLTTARGLLIEEQRTNLLLYSDQFDNAAWTKTRCSITANNATSPEGVANADKLVEDGTAASTHPVSQAVTVTAAAQTASCYLKAAERTWAQINLTGTANAFANFNLATGAIGTIGAAATATITAIANGWYRCTITSTTAAGANTFAIYPATGDNVISYNGDGVSGLYVYGAQLE